MYAMGAQTLVPHGTHINSACRVKGVSEMHILGAQHASDPANPTSLCMGYIFYVCDGCSDISAARHAHQLCSLILVWARGKGKKEVD